MAKQGKKRRKRLSNKGKITLHQRMRIVEKNDATKVVRRDTTQKRKAPFIMNDNGLNMRIKIKRKSR